MVVRKEESAGGRKDYVEMGAANLVGSVQCVLI